MDNRTSRSMKERNTETTTTNGTPIHHLDLDLPKSKLPENLKAFEASFRGHPRTVEDHTNDYAIGSSESNEVVYHKEDLGLFQSVYEAWKNHWNLRTSPEDWWFPVACRIAKAIDKVAKKEGRSDTKNERHRVREIFVEHEGKEHICVDLDVFTIYEVNYDEFFSSMSDEIKGRIKVPEFAQVMQNDFSTSTSSHRIASQINLMASVQEFFSYEMELMGCGIKGLEMSGRQEDWDSLVTKFQKVRNQLKPILFKLNLWDDWFDHVEKVFQELAKAFAASEAGSTKAIANRDASGFWAEILIEGKGWKHYGPSGMHRKEVEEYNGWIIKFLTGCDSILKEEFHDKETKEKFSGLNTVPMEVTFKYLEPPVRDKANLVAGIMGFKVHSGTDTFNGVPSVETNHMWAMTLPQNSPLRRDPRAPRNF